MAAATSSEIPSPLAVAVAQCHFDSLPHDLLVVILANIPLRPLLLVVALVSQCFRRAVPLTVRSISSRLSPRVTGDAIFDLRNLASIAINNNRRFSEEEARTLGSRITALTTDSRQRIIMGHFTNIRSLCIPASFALELMDTSTSGGALDKKSFPHLRNLEVQFGEQLSFILAHLSQLNVLTFSGANFGDPIAMCMAPAPNLTSLRIETADFLQHLPKLYKWISELPSLISLSLGFASRQLIPLPCPHLLHELTVEVRHLTTLISNEAAYPKLHRLTVKDPHQSDALVKLIMRATQLRSLSVHFVHLGRHFVAEAMPVLTTLHELHLSRYSSTIFPEEVVFKWQLPRLRVLYFGEDDTATVEHNVRTLRRILHCWPSLREIRFCALTHPQQPLNEDTWRQLDAIFAEAEAMGLQELQLGTLSAAAVTIELNLLPLLKRRKWLSITHDGYEVIEF